MNKLKKIKCPNCARKLRPDLKGTQYVIPSHNIRVLGKVNPECEGTGKVVK